MSSVGGAGLHRIPHRTTDWRSTMTTPAHPGRMLFLNLPVADLERSKAFFAGLGFSFNPGFTDETAACMLVGEQAFVIEQLELYIRRAANACVTSRVAANTTLTYRQAGNRCRQINRGNRRQGVNHGNWRRFRRGASCGRRRRAAAAARG